MVGLRPRCMMQVLYEHLQFVCKVACLQSRNDQITQRFCVSKDLRSRVAVMRS